MKIVIFGSTGMAGSMICKYLKNKYNIIEINRSDFDALKDPIPEIKCDYAINCIGITKQKDQKNIIDINVNFVKKLSKKYKLIHLSSDCVFSGNSIKEYLKYDKKDFIDIYGESKSLSELDNIMSIRTSIIGPSKDKYGLFEWFKSTKECYGYTNHIWSGITTLELAKIIDDIILKKSYNCGILQVGSTKITKYNLLNLINIVFNLKKIVIPKESNYVNRSLISDIKIKSILEQLIELNEFNL
jgi:dTDP-4-dehydrorhamnose reductase